MGQVEMLGDYSSEMEEGTAAAVRELRETARELEVSRSDYAEMQRAIQLLQVRAVSSTSLTMYNKLKYIHVDCKLHGKARRVPVRPPFLVSGSWKRCLAIGQNFFFAYEMTASRTFGNEKPGRADQR